MKTETINQIEELCSQLSNAMSNFHPKDYEGNTFGDEGEYSAQSIGASLMHLFSFCSCAYKQSNIFVRAFTYKERQDIRDGLLKIVQHLRNKNISEIIHWLEKLKPYTNRLNAVFKNNQGTDLISQANELATQITNLQKNLDTAQENIRNISSAERRITRLQQKNVSDAEENKKAVEKVHNEATGNMLTIRKILDQVDKTQTTISTQKKTFKDYENQMEGLLDQAASVLSKHNNLLLMGK